MRYVVYNSDTGEPYGSALAPTSQEAISHWSSMPHPTAMAYNGKTLPDLTGKWIVGGKLVDIADVTDETALAAIAAFETDQAQFQTVVDLAATDAGFIRVAEDLITTLIGKGVVKLTDLPQAAQDKIQSRESLRAVLNG